MGRIHAAAILSHGHHSKCADLTAQLFNSYKNSTLYYKICQKKNGDIFNGRKKIWILPWKN